MGGGGAARRIPYFYGRAARASPPGFGPGPSGFISKPILEGFASLGVQVPPIVSSEELSIAELEQQLSMLMILLAACQTAQTAFRAAANELDDQLLADLSTMIMRSERELKRLKERIEAARA